MGTTPSIPDLTIHPQLSADQIRRLNDEFKTIIGMDLQELDVDAGLQMFLWLVLAARDALATDDVLLETVERFEILRREVLMDRLPPITKEKYVRQIHGEVFAFRAQTKRFSHLTPGVDRILSKADADMADLLTQTNVAIANPWTSAELGAEAMDNKSLYLLQSILRTARDRLEAHLCKIREFRCDLKTRIQEAWHRRVQSRTDKQPRGRRG